MLGYNQTKINESKLEDEECEFKTGQEGTGKAKCRLQGKNGHAFSTFNTAATIHSAGRLNGRTDFDDIPK
jgi:hypothetical protein